MRLPRQGLSLEEASYADYFLPLHEVGSFACRTVHPKYGPGWLNFRGKSRTLIAQEFHEVQLMLSEIEESYAAGFVAFDAAPAFDVALRAQKRTGQPLAAFHVFDGPPAFYKVLEPLRCDGRGRWKLETTEEEFRWQFGCVKDLLLAGETYQVNLSFQLSALREVDLVRLCSSLTADDPPPFASLFLSDEITLVSLSPELFFEWERGHIRCKPMKGTAARSQSREEDSARAEKLRSAEKERAENLMIVDMIRNDLGKVAEIGSVKVPEIFEVEAFSTVLQMTSTIEARSTAGVGQIFKALFPCASVVGAPKIATSRIIENIELAPRGAYTGAIGWVAPAERARFSVAIRTISAAQDEEHMRYGVGAGIVWDSDPEAEWRECLLKAQALEHEGIEWGLLETLGWRPGLGYLLLERHLDRIRRSAHDLGVSCDVHHLKSVLAEAESAFETSRRVRLTLGYSGRVEVTSTKLGDPPELLRANIAPEPVASTDPGLRHKTTYRVFYDRQITSGDEALLWNEMGAATEFCNGNLVADIGGRRCTPPESSGLLPGTLRQELLERGEIEERTISLEELRGVDRIWRINSVAGWVPVKVEWHPGEDSNLRPTA